MRSIPGTITDRAYVEALEALVPEPPYARPSWVERLEVVEVLLGDLIQDPAGETFLLAVQKHALFEAQAAVTFILDAVGSEE